MTNMQKPETLNVMRNIRIEKITLNIGCGTTVKTEDAKFIIETLVNGSAEGAPIANRKAIITKTKKRTTFNVPKNKPIGAKITIREGCEEFLKRILEAREMRLPESCFDINGNLSFGIKEYIEVPRMEYEPKIGILGFDVCVTLERPGFRIKKKKIAKKVGKNHKITKDEAIKYIKENFGVEIA